MIYNAKMNCADMVKSPMQWLMDVGTEQLSSSKEISCFKAQVIGITILSVSIIYHDIFIIWLSSIFMRDIDAYHVFIILHPKSAKNSASKRNLPSDFKSFHWSSTFLPISRFVNYLQSLPQKQARQHQDNQYLATHCPLPSSYLHGVFPPKAIPHPHGRWPPQKRGNWYPLCGQINLSHFKKKSGDF